MRIPSTNAENVVLMASENLCTTGAAAYDAAVNETDNDRRVLVVRVGTVYVVSDPLKRWGEYGVHVTFSDSTFATKLVTFMH